MFEHPIRETVNTLSPIGAIFADRWLPHLHTEAQELLFWLGLFLAFCQAVHWSWRFVRWLCAP